MSFLFPLLIFGVVFYILGMVIGFGMMIVRFIAKILLALLVIGFLYNYLENEYSEFFAASVIYALIGLLFAFGVYKFNDFIKISRQQNLLSVAEDKANE